MQLIYLLLFFHEAKRYNSALVFLYTIAIQTTQMQSDRDYIGLLSELEDFRQSSAGSESLGMCCNSCCCYTAAALLSLKQLLAEGGRQILSSVYRIY